MANTEIKSVEPFADRISPQGHYFRVGYRVEGTDSVVSAIHIPVYVLEEEIASDLQLMTMLTPSGEIVSQIVGSAGFGSSGARTVTSIDKLVLETVGTDNLRREASPDELHGLLRALESAIDHVRTALAQARPDRGTAHEDR
jgi:hypothetical protein